MRLLHISDLHLGKRLKELSLAEDQKYILDQILRIAGPEEPDAVLICGDVYDRPVPPAEAVEIFDEFLVSLAKASLPVFVISGNHDSAERLAFGNRLMDTGGVHFSSVFSGQMQRYELEDEHGPLNLWMLPFIKPAHVRAYHEEIERDDYTGAVRAVIEDSGVEPEQRNVLMAHQYVTGAQRSESEEVVIGGLENVDASVFDDFDYVALGHLHKAQRAGREEIRYSGSPLKYSFGEAAGDKKILLADIGEKGRTEIREIPLKPLREMQVLQGSFEELTDPENYRGADRDAYTSVRLTDPEYIPAAMQKLRQIYPGILETGYVNISSKALETEAAADRSPVEYLEDFYRFMRGRDMTEEQSAFAEKLIRQIWDGDED